MSADAPPAVSPAEAALLPLLGLLAAEGRPLEAMYRCGGWRVRVVVEADPGRPGDDAPRAVGLNDMEADVLTAVAELGGRPNAEEIGKASGYPNDRSLRVCLAALRRRGLLTGQPGESGYGLTAAGRAASTARADDAAPAPG